MCRHYPLTRLRGYICGSCNPDNCACCGYSSKKYTIPLVCEHCDEEKKDQCVTSGCDNKHDKIPAYLCDLCSWKLRNRCRYYTFEQ